MTAIVEGSRVCILGRLGTVKRIDGPDARIVWDEPVASGVTATWTHLSRLEPVE